MHGTLIKSKGNVFIATTRLLSPSVTRHVSGSMQPNLY